MARRSQTSAGIVAYRHRAGWEVLLVHPGGPYWARRDDGAWTIPKGLVEPGADLVETARRELNEETGFTAEGPLTPLAPVRQKSGKLVYGFALKADFPLEAFRSNAFQMEWPRKSGRLREFPEVDRAGYFDLATGLTKIIDYQRPLLLELQALLEREVQTVGAASA